MKLNQVLKAKNLSVVVLQCVTVMEFQEISVNYTNICIT